MNKSIDALKLALEALEQHGCPWIRHEKPYNEAITAIREALADQCVCGEPDTPGTHRTDGPCLAEQPAPVAEPHKQQEPEYKGWYCTHCQRGVDGSEVTYHEQHTVCGRVITDDLPPSWDSFFGNAEQPAQYLSGLAVYLDPNDGLKPKRHSPQPAQQQEPVAWKDRTYGNLHHQDFGNSIPLYTSPPANANAGKPWVGLTDEDIGRCFDTADGTMGSLISAIEAKLKEKNA